MNKVIVNGVELENSVVVITTEEQEQVSGGVKPVPLDSGGPGEEH